MTLFGQPIALAIVGALLWILAIAQPISFLSRHGGALDARSGSDEATTFVATLESDAAIREALRETPIAGYVSEGPVDTRLGRALLGRYYLAQFALAPTLLDHEASTRGPYELVLGCFSRPDQLETFLAEDSRRIAVSVSPGIALTRLRRPR